MNRNKFLAPSRKKFCGLLAVIAIGQWAFIAYKVSAAESATLIAEKKHAVEGKWADPPSFDVSGNNKKCSYIRKGDTCEGNKIWVQEEETRKGWPWEPVTVIPAHYEEVDDPNWDCYEQPLSVAAHYTAGESNVTISQACPATPNILIGNYPDGKHNDSVHR